jgi:hypothetical protein
MVYQYEEVEKSELEEEGFEAGDSLVMRAVDWEPMEVSFVAVPFDDQANVRLRDGEGQSTECEFILKTGDKTMPKLRSKSEKAREEEEKRESAAEDAEEEKEAAEDEEEMEESEAEVEEGEEEAAADDEEEKEASQKKKQESSMGLKLERKRAAKLERERIQTILSACKRAGLDQEFADSIIEKGVGKSRAIEMIHEKWSQEGNDVPTKNITVGNDRKLANMKEGMENALMNRIYSDKFPLSEPGKEYRGRTLLGLAEDCLNANGIKTRNLAPSEVAAKALSRDFKVRAGMHGTGDFANLLLDAANKTLRQSYEFAPQTFRPFVRFTTNRDFKNINRVQQGEAPSLDLVGQHGEITYGTFGDSKETYALQSYAKAFAITRQALINDDLDGFARVPRSFGMAGANKESSLVYAILTGNPNMGDGNPLFDSSNHSNVGTTGAIGDTTLSEMRELGRKQYGINNTTDPLNVVHEFLVVPAAKEVAAMKYLNQVIVPETAANANVFRGMYTPIVEPRLDASSSTAWYGIANPNLIDTIEVCFLEGQQGVRIDTEIDFDTDGMKMKAMHDVAAKAIDWRGMFKNVGA